MTQQKKKRAVRTASVAVGLLLVTQTAVAESPLDLFLGEWEARVETTEPERVIVTYKERYEWTLDGAILHGTTYEKSDGIEDLIIGAYDKNGKGYSFWIFSSADRFYVDMQAGRC